MSTRGPDCCACGRSETSIVLDLGRVCAADVFPLGGTPARDERHELAMAVCPCCGLAQIAHDDTAAEQPLGVEPQALLDQARCAVDAASGRGWLTGSTVREFPSPHGGSWVPLLLERDYTETNTPAAVVLDSFGVMHEPDQQAAFRARAEATSADGVLLLQFHSLSAIVANSQWSALRHGHAAYYSLTALKCLLADVGMSLVGVEVFDLYGGTVLAAARHGIHEPDGSVSSVLACEERQGIAEPAVLRSLQSAVDKDVSILREWLEARRAEGQRVYAYGAASVAVSQFDLAELDRTLVAGVADAAAGKHGRRMPGTDIPIMSPEELVEADPDLVLVMLPDLLSELERSYPQLAGRWVIRGGGRAS